MKWMKLGQTLDKAANVKNYNYIHQGVTNYLLGAEDHGLSDDIKNKCNQLVSLDAVRAESYNVSIAGALVMYNRVYLS